MKFIIKILTFSRDFCIFGKIKNITNKMKQKIKPLSQGETVAVRKIMKLRKIKKAKKTKKIKM
jgi:hypothetical protein